MKAKKLSALLVAALLITKWVNAGTPLVRIQDKDSKVYVGPVLTDTATDMTILDLKDDREIRIQRSAVKTLDRDITDESAARTVGLSNLAAYRVAEIASAENPVGKIARISQGTIYITLGNKSGVKVNQLLGVYRTVGDIKDPVTKKVIAIERPKIGILEITEVQSDFAKGRSAGEIETQFKIGDEVGLAGEKMKIAVAPLVTESGQVLDVGVGIAESIITRLAKKNVSVVERSTLDRVIDEQKLQAGDQFDPAGAQKVGELAGASVIVTGKIVARGKVGTVYLRLIDVQTGAIIYAVSGTVSLANAKSVDAGLIESTNSSPFQFRPVPKGAFRSAVIDLTLESSPEWFIKPAIVGQSIQTDRPYALMQIPREVAGGTLIVRPVDDCKDWLDYRSVFMRKRGSVFTCVRWSYLGRVQFDEVAVAKLLQEGWAEVDGELRTTFPSGEDWKWKVFRKEVDEGIVTLQLNTLKWPKDNPVLFVFK